MPLSYIPGPIPGTSEMGIIQVHCSFELKYSYSITTAPKNTSCEFVKVQLKAQFLFDVLL